MTGVRERTSSVVAGLDQLLVVRRPQHPSANWIYRPGSPQARGGAMAPKTSVSVVLIAILAFILVPARANAQVAIAGQVKDTSGAVLPGVTVEAASPALIEKVRTVVADDQGAYKLLDLVPGVYTVTFTLTGFKTVQREGI